jgi:putative ABC transport system substrate-binding protein
MRRRAFISLLGGAAAWPLVARAQQGKTLPTIGFLNGGSPNPNRIAAFRRGLNESGYVEGHNVTIDYHWAEGQYDRLPALARDLIRRQVTVIAATSTPAAMTAKAATTTIPIVFELGSDPVRLGLVASFSQPGGNVTGATQLNLRTAPKRLQLLHELLPAVSVMALLVNPLNPAVSETDTKEVGAAARALGLELHVLNTSTEDDFDAVFAKLIQLRAGGLVIGGGPLFASRSERLAALTVRHAVPAIAPYREFAVAGGLLSYGSDIGEAYRLAGI